MNILCFGDSNTYGYDPRSYFGDRYHANSRWVDLFANKTGWNLINSGQNGRQIPHDSISVPKNIDLLIVMLGTNDLLQGNNVSQVVGRMHRFLVQLDFPKEKIYLIAPPPLKMGAWVSEQNIIDNSFNLGEAYSQLAKSLGTQFIDTKDWQIPLAYDGVHFTEEGHRIFAEHLSL